MNGSAGPHGKRMMRTHATPKVAPITRAIRNAMAVSATVLALSGSGLAQAGVRGADATAPVRAHSAALLATMPDAPPVDLTRVGGNQHPSSVLAAKSAGTAVAGSSDIQTSAPSFAPDPVVDYANYTDIVVSSQAVDDIAIAVGMYGAGAESTTLRNYGSVSAAADSVSGYAITYGVSEYAGFAGIGLAINGGTIDVASTAGAGAQAHATGINVVADVASVFNDASIHATATAGDGGVADARGARAYGDYSTVSTYVDITAHASADGGIALARGADALGYNGASVYNAGSIAVDASAVGGQATATGS